MNKTWTFSRPAALRVARRFIDDDEPGDAIERLDRAIAPERPGSRHGARRDITARWRDIVAAAHYDDCDERDEQDARQYRLALLVGLILESAMYRVAEYETHRVHLAAALRPFLPSETEGDA